MMRKIRFRGLCTKGRSKGKMVYGCGVSQLAKSKPVFLFKSSSESYEVEENSVGMLTEFKDKNKKQIWENDTVKTPYIGMFNEVIPGKFETGTVVFNEGCFVVRYPDDRYIYLSELVDEIEVQDIDITTKEE